MRSTLRHIERGSCAVVTRDALCGTLDRRTAPYLGCRADGGHYRSTTATWPGSVITQ